MVEKVLANEAETEEIWQIIARAQAGDHSVLPRLKSILAIQFGDNVKKGVQKLVEDSTIKRIEAAICPVHGQSPKNVSVEIQWRASALEVREVLRRTGEGRRGDVHR